MPAVIPHSGTVIATAARISMNTMPTKSVTRGLGNHITRRTTPMVWKSLSCQTLRLALLSVSTHV